MARFAEAFEGGDIDGIVQLLTDDALLTMPPQPLEYEGHEAIGAFLANRSPPTWGRHVRCVWTRADGQPAFGHYTESPVRRCAARSA